MRGSFHLQYLTPAHKVRPAANSRRLGDLLLVVAEHDHENSDVEGYLSGPTRQKEFIVFDTVTREKAWFEMPEGYTSDMITGLISSHFEATATQVLDRVWVV